MKKIVVLFMSLVLGAAILSGCTKEDEAFTQKSYTADGEQIKKISIDVRDREIEVLLSADNQIHIDYFDNSKEYYELSVSDDHTLTMTAASDKDWTDYIGGKAGAGSRKILLRLPDALLTTLEVSTTNEAISIPALTIAGDLSLSAQGGDIVFDKLNVGKSIRLNAKNGDIRGSILGSYDDYTISCNIKKGESNLPSSIENGTKTLTVSNNNGDIDIEFVSK